MERAHASDFIAAYNYVVDVVVVVDVVFPYIVVVVVVVAATAIAPFVVVVTSAPTATPNQVNDDTVSALVAAVTVVAYDPTVVVVAT